MTASKVYPTCPRCSGPIPNATDLGGYPGALSRTDNATEICSDCGTREAMEQMTGPQYLTPQSEWIAFREFDGEL